MHSCWAEILGVQLNFELAFIQDDLLEGEHCFRLFGQGDHFSGEVVADFNDPKLFKFFALDNSNQDPGLFILRVTIKKKHVLPFVKTRNFQLFIRAVSDLRLFSHITDNLLPFDLNQVYLASAFLVERKF